jgi:threonine synthase|tara:strand:- start:126 stop:1496 length:1371 start_codon:yes stop_codon:yes gene_type:complete
MKYVSTRGGVSPVRFKDAVMMGLASDGGLMVPYAVPDVRAKLPNWARLTYPELAFEVIRVFSDDINEDVLKRMTEESYSGFGHADVAPLRGVGSLHVLELFHGPTLAFKDFALQFLGELFSHILLERGQTLNILGATSGDTGSAAIHAMRGRPGIRVLIMFPDGRTSPLQELQMTTVLDDNIFNLAVDGSFDDCQQLLKSVFNDLQFKQAFSLGAVNSVNWARVLAQVVYYFWAWYQLRCPAVFDVTVPTGNFGNIFAGYLAKKMGLPLGRLNLATNDNDILARFFRSGVYERGPVHFSLSPAMDIQVASNFERYLYFQLGGDAEGVKTFMSGFQDSQTSTLEHLHGDFDWFQAGAVTDAETVATIEKVFDQFGYLADPHTAVGIAIAEQYQRVDVPMVAVATAHPAKFVEAVEQALPHTPNHHPTLQALAGKETRRYDLDASEASLKTFIEGACA